jgi:GxxExxY protein
MDRNKINTIILDTAIEVHKFLGPGMVEFVYRTCFCKELSIRGVRFQRNVTVPVIYKNIELDTEFKIDILVEDEVIVEIIAEDSNLNAHEARLQSALKLTDKKVAVLINFQSNRLIDGYKKITKNFH